MSFTSCVNRGNLCLHDLLPIELSLKQERVPLSKSFFFVFTNLFSCLLPVSWFAAKNLRKYVEAYMNRKDISEKLSQIKTLDVLLVAGSKSPYIQGVVSIHGKMDKVSIRSSLQVQLPVVAKSFGRSSKCLFDSQGSDLHYWLFRCIRRFAFWFILFLLLKSNGFVINTRVGCLEVLRCVCVCKEFSCLQILGICSKKVFWWWREKRKEWICYHHKLWFSKQTRCLPRRLSIYNLLILPVDVCSTSFKIHAVCSLLCNWWVLFIIFSLWNI